MNKRKVIENLLQKDMQIENRYGLFDGKAGICLYYFITGKYLNSSQRTEYANILLEDIYNNISPKAPIDLTSGLTGISLMLAYLIHHGYSQGDVNIVLKKIDNHIYKIACNAIEMDLNKKASVPLIDVLIYTIMRYKEVNDEDEKWLLKRLIVDLFNYIYINKTDSFFWEPLPFSIQYPLCQYLWALTEIYKIGIEQKRIKYILREMHYIVFAQKPILQANRLVLSLISSIIGREIELSHWTDYADSLMSNIDIQYILNEEMHDKNIFPINGIIGIYFLIMEYNKLNTKKIFINEYNLLRRILNSSAWERAEKDKKYFKTHGTLKGFLGVLLFIDYIIKQRKI